MTANAGTSSLRADAGGLASWFGASAACSTTLKPKPMTRRTKG